MFRSGSSASSGLLSAIRSPGSKPRLDDHERGRARAHHDRHRFDDPPRRLKTQNRSPSWETACRGTTIASSNSSR